MRILILSLVLSNVAFSEANVIYDGDDRYDLDDSSVPNSVKALGASVAAIVDRAEVDVQGSDAMLRNITFEQTYGMCSTERFLQQPSAALCSGVLVEPRVLLTASSCIPNQTACDRLSVAFGFDMLNPSPVVHQIPTNDLYACDKVIKVQADDHGQSDFTLVYLDRQVTGRSAISVADAPNTTAGAPIFSLGNLGGLPTKWMTNAQITTDYSTYFTANLDASNGALGSPVFSANNKIIGIITRGEQDLIIDQQCSSTKICAPGDLCQGQYVSKSSLFAKEIDDPNIPSDAKTYQYDGINLPIPDNDPTGIDFDIEVPQQLKIAQVLLDIHIEHMYIGDLIVTLIAPDRTKIILHNRTGGQNDDLKKSYIIGPELRGRPSVGTWKLNISDNESADEGELIEVKMILKTYLQ